MAEVATKKSISVVSSKKNEVCSVQSNNGLIDLGNITASNNQLISLCDNNDDDDDLVIANNTRNELDSEDKSLQELIESELALRICSRSDDSELVVESEEGEQTTNQPETIKRIVLDRQQDPFQINNEFIVAEAEHCSVVEEGTYGYQNGHVSPERPNVNVDPEPTKHEDEEEESRMEPEEEIKSKLAIPTEEKERPATDKDDETLDAKVSASNDDEEEPFYREDESKTKVVPTNPREDDEELVLNKDETVESKVMTIGPADTEEFDEELVFYEEPEGNATVVLQVTVPSNDDKLEDSNNEVQDQLSLDECGVSNPENESRDVVDEAASENQGVVASLDRADKHQEEEEPVQTKAFVDPDADVLRNGEETREKKEIADSWTTNISSTEGHTVAVEFSDNFDETICDEHESAENLAKESSTVESTASDATNDEKPQTAELTVAKVVELKEDSPQGASSLLSRSFDESTLSRSETSTDVASTQEFLDIERRVLNEEMADQSPLESSVDERFSSEDAKTEGDETKTEEIEVSRAEHAETVVLDSIAATSCVATESKRPKEFCAALSNASTKMTEEESKFDSWMTVEEATRREEETASETGEEQVAPLEKTEVEETVTEGDDEVNEMTKADNNRSQDVELASATSPRAPLATPDDETSDIANTCDSESREETITSSSTVVTGSSSVKGSTKTKKKKIEGVAGSDASPNLTPRTKKTKKSKKSELEKENISVNGNTQDSSMHSGSRHSESIDLSDEDDLSNVNVKSLTQNYVSEANRNELDKCNKERIATGVSIKQLCRSFGDISNMTDGDQTTFGKSNHSTDVEEKARSMGDLRLCEQACTKQRHCKDAPIFTGVSVKALRASYCSLASLTRDGKDREVLRTPKLQKSSFNKFDALSKKTVLHVRSVDAGKVQQQLNAVGQNGDANQNCRSCGKVVFQMEQTKAEGLVWHKNCFRCVQCSKQLNVDNYESHESTLYCKPHFKELFQPKPVEESEQPVRPRKPELIIRENEPKELPPDVVRASDKPDLGLEELSSLNVKSRFQVFEKAGTENTNEIERSPSQIAVKRSPSILSKLAKFQAKGMDIGVADESLNGIPYEESSESEEEEAEEVEEVDSEIVKAKRATRERPISFSKMDDIKNRWESTSQQGRREVQREARKEEIAGIRSRLFMGKQGKMKEMYQQAVAGSERVTKINAAEEIQHSTHARSIKERFERGEPLAASDDETDNKPKPEKADEEVIAAGISRKSRSLFLELDASAAKSGRPVTPVNAKTPADTPRRARDAFMGRQVSDDIVRSSDTTEEVHVETSDISNKFKFFESYKEPEKQRKQFRITPPRDGQVKMNSPEREIYRDPDVVRADDRVDEVVHTDTARKMLSIFRQMEENACKEELPEGPKPLKRFTPPPEDKYAKPTASDSEDEEDEDGEESEGEESSEEKDPNYVRASDKVEDEFLKQAQNAARAKTLRAKFEHWEETDGKQSHQNIAEMELAQSTGDQSSIESASSLRARFESLGSAQTNESLRVPKIKVNRFVEIQAGCTDVCESCEKKVYPLEKVETNNKIFHKQCFRCLQCNCILRMDTFTLNNGKLYCIPHFKQLFITRGNYDEGFGVDPHKNKWATGNANSATTASPIAVSNGDL